MLDCEQEGNLGNFVMRLVVVVGEEGDFWGRKSAGWGNLPPEPGTWGAFRTLLDLHV